MTEMLRAKPAGVAGMTADEFLLREWPARERWELLDGTPVQMNAPTTTHQLVIAALHLGLVGLDPERELGIVFFAPTDLRLPAGDVFQPDVMLVDPATPMPENKYVHGVPKLVVEVLSSDRKRDEVDKLIAYQRAGVPEYWLVDPESLDLTLLVLADDGRYTVVPPDADGASRSPIYGRLVRLNLQGTRHVLHTGP